MLVCLAALAGLPLGAAAQDRMTEAACQQGFKRLVLMWRDDSPDVLELVRSVRATEQGWCILRPAGLADLEDLPFEAVEWRTEDGARWTRDGIPPLALELRAIGVDPDDLEEGAATDRPDLTVEATFRQDLTAGAVIVERAALFNEVGDEMAVSGVFERVFLSSPAMMQVSMGSAAFKAGLIRVTLEGTHENPFGFGVDVDLRGDPAAQREGVFNTISNLPDGVVDDASRAEFMAFASDLPSPVGTLEVQADSARGLGLMQFGASVAMSFTASTDPDPDAERDRLEILLDGMTLRADWSPAAQEAD